MDLKSLLRKKKPDEQTEQEEWENPPFVYAPLPKPRVGINVLLFFFTLLTTIFAGALQEGVNPFENPGQIYRGIPFSFSLMGILLAHEFGHYLAA